MRYLHTDKCRVFIYIGIDLTGCSIYINTCDLIKFKCKEMWLNELVAEPKDNLVQGSLFNDEAWYTKKQPKIILKYSTST